MLERHHGWWPHPCLRGNRTGLVLWPCESAPIIPRRISFLAMTEAPQICVVNVGHEKSHKNTIDPIKLPLVPTMWGPQDISWFRFAPVTIVINTINHSEIGVICTNWTLSNGGLTLYENNPMNMSPLVAKITVLGKSFHQQSDQHGLRNFFDTWRPWKTISVPQIF